MIRKRTTILAVVISCLTAVGEAGASPIVATNHDLWVAVQDPLFAGPTVGAFQATAPSPAIRTLTSNEYFSFSDSAARGSGAAGDFSIDLDLLDGGTLDWGTAWLQYNMIDNEIGPAAGLSLEPGTMALLGAGVLGLYGMLRRRRNLMS